MSRNTCAMCGLLNVAPTGPEDASILLVVDSPDYEEIRNGRLGSGKIGEILRKEMSIAGIQMSSCRLVSLWKHAKSKECSAEEHLQHLVIGELQGHEWVVLMGTEISKALTGHGIMEITGLQVKSKLFPKIRFFGIPSPASLLHGDVGEMRLSLEKFNAARRKKK